MCHIFFIHSFVNGHLGCFHILAIVNSAAVSIVVHISFWIMIFSGYMPSSGIAESYDKGNHKQDKKDNPQNGRKYLWMKQLTKD